MDYKETLNYLYQRLPMFSKLGAAAIKKDLTNTIAFCKRLNAPQNRFLSVHVGGTNGKGSVSHMLAAVLQTAGYKTGLYTSPHLRDFRERIRINGDMIPEGEVINFVSEQQKSIEEIEPSFFEVTAAMAFHYFAKEEVDIAIIEVGLGGRLDSTNVITPLLSIITNIGYDHTDILGNTLAQIAWEKAGIIKPGIPVVIGERHIETEKVFLEKAAEVNSKITFAPDIWSVEPFPGEVQSMDVLLLQAERLSSKKELIDLSIDLPGSYQLNNIKTVLSALDSLNLSKFTTTDSHIKNGLSSVKKLTGLLGRWHTLNSNPLIICDTGHNEHGMKEVIKNIHNTPYKKLHMVIGMVKDKDILKILALLPSKASYYFCAPNLERAKPANELQEQARKFHLYGNTFPSVKHALDTARNIADKDDFIFVGGSTFVVAEII